MSNLSILRGVIAFIDDVDGKGADTYAAALMADPRFADQMPGVVTAELLAEVLEEHGAALRAIAETQPTEITGNLLKVLAKPKKGPAP